MPLPLSRNVGGRLLVYNLGNVEKWKEVMKKMNERRKCIQLDTVEKKEEEKSTVDTEENSENVVDGDLSISPLSDQL